MINQVHVQFFTKGKTLEFLRYVLNLQTCVKPILNLILHKT
jgi:hypothetical protein